MVPTQEGQDLRALKLSVAVYLGILAMKLGAYWATGVMVLLAEATVGTIERYSCSPARARRRGGRADQNSSTERAATASGGLV
ncbi:MAG: hypothetical protein HY329_00370 [Chloroflexi bacterium]|nr:hypothetical protein [Chloroflexota bacterium]